MAFSPYDTARRPDGGKAGRGTRERDGERGRKRDRDRPPQGTAPHRGKSTGKSGRESGRENFGHGKKRLPQEASDRVASQGHGRRAHGSFDDPEVGALREALSPDNLRELPEDGTFSVHIAPRGLMGPLVKELGDRVLAIRGRVVLARGDNRPLWAQTTWIDPFWMPVASISDAARKLRALQPLWHAHEDRESGLNRRTTLVREALPHVSAKPLVFPSPAPTAPMGAFLLWRSDLALAARRTTSPFPDGEARFVEDRETPPGRAYLKLWESFTLFGERPAAGELCLELGAAPGSWTWVLAELGARVFSLDKAPLAPHVETRPNVEHCLGSGFAMTPDISGRVDWLFSDMICYPERLLRLVLDYVEARAMRRALCTIKFRSDADYALLSEFASIPGSTLRHLSCNRHELTWFYREPETDNAAATDTAVTGQTDGSASV